MTTNIKQCIRLSKKIRLKYQYDKLASIKPIVETYNFNKFSALPITLIWLLFHITYHLIVNAYRLFSIAVQLPLTPKDRSLYQLWCKYGLNDTHDLDIRLNVLHDWLSILYGQDIDLHILVRKIRAEHSAAYKHNGNGICISYADIVDSILWYELELPDYD